MRVISGKLKGRQIKFPKNIRPTQNKVRKAVFDCLGDSVKGSVFLELFAGSGAVGIEAFSYGASRVVFVDSNINCLKLIETNLISLGIKPRRDKDGPECQIYRKDSLEALCFLRKKGLKFDLIFLDPPYLTGLAKKSLLGIASCDILNSLGIVIIEHYKKEELPQTEGSLILFKRKYYGGKIVSFYSKETRNQSPETRKKD